MIIVELVLTAYVTIVLGTAGFIESVTGLYPAQQLDLVQQHYGLPSSYGVMDTIGAVISS
ncbi:hypothetical protein FGG66_gp29 [Corynebacterium phage phi674]|uniref:Uncharacterized protein n=1 Tax=Corynebacterium phage phi674 TaxID=2052822 RepID=A0A2H4PIZ0_9CAUD|nr:hypothetical protein FGG66_gp29 [Corynebacterium phage phi674]ATW62947.1 hypothetical protein phi674_gp29 [Corynebacterium phage phi674]